MYSQEQRKLAIETFIKFDHSYADAIAELGYPTRAALRIWWNECKKMERIDVELCGSWLWIGGDTYPHCEALKAAGCLWSRSKKRWYWRHAEDDCRWSRETATMSEIRGKYDSEWLRKPDERETLLA